MVCIKLHKTTFPLKKARFFTLVQKNVCFASIINKRGEKIVIGKSCPIISISMPPMSVVTAAMVPISPNSSPVQYAF